MAKRRGEAPSPQTLAAAMATGEQGPTWSEFLGAIRAQVAEFSQMVAQSEARSDKRFNEIMQLMKESNEATRQWVEELRNTANVEHSLLRQGIEDAKILADAATNTVNTRVTEKDASIKGQFDRMYLLLGGSVVIITSLVGIGLWLGQRWAEAVMAAAAH